MQASIELTRTFSNDGGNGSVNVTDKVWLSCIEINFFKFGTIVLKLNFQGPIQGQQEKEKFCVACLHSP